jgi:hypothetical protein
MSSKTISPWLNASLKLSRLVINLQDFRTETCALVIIHMEAKALPMKALAILLVSMMMASNAEAIK